VLLPSTGPINSISVTAGGGSYTSDPAVVITGVGTGAAAHSVRVGNSVSSVVVDTAGTGYDKTTTISFTGGGGSGAAATANLTVNNALLAQEVYTFPALTAVAALTSGVASILGVISISVSWGAMKPTLKQTTWSDFQAFFRAYSTGLQSFPAVWAQYMYGSNGSVYVYPLPSQNTQWDWDTWCKPIDLIDDTTAEAIPYPWTDAIPFYAAHFAYDNSQRKDDADRMFKTYELFMKRARGMSENVLIPDMYDTGGDW
jgi:hypothetical protein